MADQFICDQIAVQVAQDLMDFDDDFIFRPFGELQRLDMRVDHRPLGIQ